MPYLMPWIVVAVAGLLTVVGVYGLTRPMTGGFWKSLLRSLSIVILLLPAPVPGYEGLVSGMSPRLTASREGA